MKIIWIALVGVALVAGSASGASKGSSVDLVAYSTPKDAYGKIISAFQGTSAGSGVGGTPALGQARQTGGRLPSQALPPRARPARQRAHRAAGLRAGQGRRAAHIPERGDLRREEGRPHRVPHPEGDAADRDTGRAHEDRADEAR